MSDYVELQPLAEFIRLIADDPKEAILGLNATSQMSLVGAGEGEAQACLRRFGLDSLDDKDVTHLSEGQRVRLTLASAFASGVAILLLTAHSLTLIRMVVGRFVTRLRRHLLRDNP